MANFKLDDPAFSTAIGPAIVALLSGILVVRAA
jgi:hypothetical protein